VLDGGSWPADELSPDLARALCDRHTGIGADGVLWLGPGDGASTDAQLVILNADGSRPEMCGNGVRCVAAYMLDRGALATGATLRLATDAGPRPPSIVAGPDARGAVSVAVDMGAAQVAPGVVNVAAGARQVAAVAVHVGNPHAVLFDPVPDEARMDVVHALERQRAVWPQGVNVEFVTPAPEGGALDVEVHERGVGWTLACGTGAVAVAAAAVDRGRAPRGPNTGGEASVVRVNLPGGGLEIAVAGVRPAYRTRMTGPARRVFAGTLDEARLRAVLAGGAGPA
jgi:diaminopimelate epimerase